MLVQSEKMFSPCHGVRENINNIHNLSPVSHLILKIRGADSPESLTKVINMGI